MEKTITRLFAVGCALLLLFCLLLSMAETSVKKVDLSPVGGAQVNGKLAYYLESIETIEKPFYQGGGELVLKGWIVLPEANVSSICYQVLLKPEGETTALALPVKLLVRKDVQEIYQGGTEKCAFIARVKLSKLSLADTRYEIVLGYQCNGANDLAFTAQTIGGDSL